MTPTGTPKRRRGRSGAAPAQTDPRPQESAQPEGAMYKLWFGTRPPDEAGIPLLPPYYSYLLRLAPGVGVVDIYPWLAELLFYSAATSDPKPNPRSAIAALNVVGFFIDEHQFTLAATMGGEPYFGTEDPTKNPFREYKEKLCIPAFESKGHHDKFPRHFLVDTFGSFGDSDTDDTHNCLAYHSQRVPGSGNPMLLMRAFRKIATMQSVVDSPGKQADLKGLNLFLINSITYLCRTMGFRDAMLFVREILRNGVWKPPDGAPNETPAENVDKRPPHRLIDNDGMLFAILHDGVFSPTETKYAETFFDGVLVFERNPIDGIVGKTIRYWWERLPPLSEADSTDLATIEMPCAYRVQSGLGRISAIDRALVKGCADRRFRRSLGFSLPRRRGPD